jgi:carboxypeptidase Q
MIRPAVRLTPSSLLPLALALTLSLGAPGKGLAQEPVDREVTRRILAEGLERSQILGLYTYLTDLVGPRLTATPAFKAAADWAVETLEGWGASDVHLEAWDFGRGWTLEGLTLEMTSPRYFPLVGYPDAWSPSTAGVLSGTPVYVGDKTLEELEGLRPQLKGAIVLTTPPQTQFITEDRPQPAEAEEGVRSGAPPSYRARGPVSSREMSAFLQEAGAGVALRPNMGQHGTIFVTGNRNTPDDAGTDPEVADEIVLVGAHLDSWHAATGGSDNADGVSATMEALRILLALEVQPRRTIRIGLWGGEEEGLLGARAWVEAHLAGEANQAARERFYVYLNNDPGYGKIYGWYLEENDAVKPVFDAWLEPLKETGALKNVREGIGSTDHVPFLQAGVPAFNAIQEYRDYDVRTHHTNQDFHERVAEEDLKQSAVVLAVFAYHAAMREGRLPVR